MSKYSEFYWKKGKDNVYRPIAICTECGREFKSNNVYAARYCPNCAAKIKRKKTADRVRRFREKERLL